MAKFSYTIINKKNRSESGQIEAVSREEAASLVKKKDWFIVSLQEEKALKYHLPFLNHQDRLSAYERIAFTDHLAAMFKSGTTLVDALKTYKDEETKRGAVMIDGIVKAIERGEKLSRAMTAYPETFSPLYLALVQSGELSGRLDEALKYMAKELRRDFEFQEKIKSALFYPALVMFVALLVVILLIFVVVPKITIMAKSLSGDLPLITRLVSSAASFLTDFGPLLILLFLGAAMAIFIFLKNKGTKEKLDPYFLKIVLVGPLLKKYILARFLRIVGSCLKYGIPFSLSLKIAAKVVGNISYQQACIRIETKITKGVSLSEALSQEKSFLFPRTIIQTIKGAEKTGYVEAALLRFSTFYEDSIDRELKRITELIEPILVIFLGIVVATIAIAVIAPIYQITTKIK